MPDEEPPHIDYLAFLKGGPQLKPGDILPSERPWLSRRDWLQSQGYILRPRYQADWVPSWNTTGKVYLDCEDGAWGSKWGRHIDATRASDGAFVLLKHVESRYSPFEPEIGQYFSKPPLRDDPNNHCMPVLDVLPVPENPEGETVIVTPLLRTVHEPHFETFGEIIAFFSQMFEGIQFMHKHGVAHRDCTFNNVMMDATPMYPHPWHPAKPERRRDWKGRAKYYSRTQCPVKYYWIDFGHSRRYNLEDGPPLEMPQRAGDYTPPEHAGEFLGTPCNPFPTDIYLVGNMIRTHYMEASHRVLDYSGLGFMNKLVVDMVQADPAKRPTIDEVVSRFADIRKSLSAWKLRSRIIYKRDNISHLWKFPRYCFSTIRYVLTRTPAIPDI
ncbi:hypothetical protein OF83DRAFT_1070441 [Amylostereum chailletii]|nr:hypothetical protein OF83DRAFT_1070441 [Amylostereum chailletii]